MLHGSGCIIPERRYGPYGVKLTSNDVREHVAQLVPKADGQGISVDKRRASHGRNGAIYAVSALPDQEPVYCFKSYLGSQQTRHESFAPYSIYEYVSKVGYERPAGIANHELPGLMEMKALQWALQLPGIEQLGVSVPEPFAYSEQYDAVLMRWVKGQNMRQSLFRTSTLWTFGPAITPYNQRLLEAVAEFISNLRLATPSYVSLADLASAHIQFVSAPGVPSQLRERAVAALRSSQSVQIPLCPTHGECSPRNFLVQDAASPSGPTVYAIDWGSAFLGPRYFDFHTFATNLRWWSIAPWTSNARLSALAAFFSTQYFQHEGYDELPFQYTRLLYLIAFAWKLTPWLHSFAGRLLSYQFKKFIGNEMEEALTAIETHHV